MYKKYILLNVFLIVSLFGESQETNFYGLKPEVCAQLQKEVGRKPWALITKYLKKDVKAIENNVQAHSWVVGAFHSYTVTETNAPLLAQMKDCPTCPTLGQLVTQSEYLKSMFPKIVKAQTAITQERKLRHAQNEVQKTKKTLHELLDNLDTAEQELKEVEQQMFVKQSTTGEAKKTNLFPFFPTAGMSYVVNLPTTETAQVSADLFEKMEQAGI